MDFSFSGHVMTSLSGQLYLFILSSMIRGTRVFCPPLAGCWHAALEADHPKALVDH